MAISWPFHGHFMVISWSLTFSRLALATVLCPTAAPPALAHDDDDDDDDEDEDEDEDEDDAD
eukprot:4764972-Lingulodinium_polyedra.AAC.1